MDTKRFTKNDNGFVCESCGATVEPLRYTSRNHCPKCLCSLHLDVNPGDRAAGCGGIMDAVFAEPDAKRGFIVTHRCTQIYLCRIHDNSVSKLFQEGKGATLCDEITHQKAISQKASLYLICDDISFLTMGPYGLRNITFQIPRKEC